MSIIRCIPNPVHEARCVAAIKERRLRESSFRVGEAGVSNVVKMRKRAGAPSGTGFRAFGIEPLRVSTKGFNPSRGEG